MFLKSVAVLKKTDKTIQDSKVLKNQFLLFLKLLPYAHISHFLSFNINLSSLFTKWRAASGVLCDRNIPLKLKGKFYKVAIRPAMLYGSECWPISKALANRVEVGELRMIRLTCGKTLLDMIPSGVFRAKLEVENIISKMREGRLRWFGHVRRRP